MKETEGGKWKKGRGGMVEMGYEIKQKRNQPAPGSWQ